MFPIYSKTSVTRTPMARLQWLVRELVFESLGHSLDNPRKQIFMDILGKFSHFIINVCYVYSFESPHRSDSNEYINYTIIKSTEDRKHILRLYLFAS